MIVLIWFFHVSGNSFIINDGISNSCHILSYEGQTWHTLGDSRTRAHSLIVFFNFLFSVGFYSNIIKSNSDTKNFIFARKIQNELEFWFVILHWYVSFKCNSGLHHLSISQVRSFVFKDSYSCQEINRFFFVVNNDNNIIVAASSEIESNIKS